MTSPSLNSRIQDASQLCAGQIFSDPKQCKVFAEKFERILTESLEPVRQTLADLVDQFHAYENGWLGENVWRTRIGLPDALTRAEALLKETQPELQNGTPRR